MLRRVLVEHDICIVGNMKFDAFIEARGYEFAIVVDTLPLKGATGSPVRPFAVK